MPVRKFTGPKRFVAFLVAGAAAWFVWKEVRPSESAQRALAIQSQPRRATTTGPRIGNCPVFPADNVWNTPVDRLKKDTHAMGYIDNIGALIKVHADFGSNPASGIPFNEISPDARGARIGFDYDDESDPGNYPVPDKVSVENGSDAHLIMIDMGRCILYELNEAHLQTGGLWKAVAGVKMDLTSNALRADGKTSADAAGLPIFPGLVRYDEVESGEIKHALRFTLENTQGAYVWPARHKASNSQDPNRPPMGMRFRLRGDFDISKFSKTNQIIMTALKRYGLILADNGGSMFISGVPDKRWDDDDLHKLSAMYAEDFEAVDESAWQMLPDSGRVDPSVPDK